MDFAKLDELLATPSYDYMNSTVDALKEGARALREENARLRTESEYRNEYICFLLGSYTEEEFTRIAASYAERNPSLDIAANFANFAMMLADNRRASRSIVDPAQEQTDKSCDTCGWSKGGMKLGCNEPDFVSTKNITCVCGSRCKPIAPATEGPCPEEGE